MLGRARTIGLLGPGPIEQHVAHARRFADLVSPVSARGPLLDLGSGGGVPGLVVAELLPEVAIDLLDGRARRAAFLRDAVDELGLKDRVRILEGRAEALGRGPDRGRYAAVLSRGFGVPAVTAECAAPFLASGGLLVVSEPPEASPRWPEEGLAMLGLQLRERTAGPAFVVIEATRRCPERFPRRVGVPEKRPLF